MKNKKKIDNLTKHLKEKLDKLHKLQDQMLVPKEMIGASLIKRNLGTQKKKRSSCAFYLSTAKNGRTKLQHISKNNIDTIQTKVTQWKKYQADIKTWRNLTEDIYKDFKQLGKLQNQLEQK